MYSKEEWLNLLNNINGEDFILSFIYDFINSYSSGNSKIGTDVIKDIFSNKYCYYFANILADNFEGQVMWVFKKSHIVFKSIKGICYDIGGVYNSNNEVLFSIEALSNKTLGEFKHTCEEELEICRGDISEKITWILYQDGTLSVCGSGLLFPKDIDELNIISKVENIEIAPSIIVLDEDNIHKLINTVNFLDNLRKEPTLVDTSKVVNRK